MIQVNQRNYRPRSRPIVAICLDGTSQDYLDQAAEVMPNLRRICEEGAHGEGRGVIPSLTNPNNVAIITGTPPEINGIPGNYYYDSKLDQEVMMNDPKYVRCPTILSAFSRSGHPTAAITTKDKLRRILAKDLEGICFSVEKAAEVTLEENGIEDVVGIVGRPNPGIYDPEASVYCMEAGARLLESRKIDLMYLTTTDYVQHKNPPGSAEANRFLSRMDVFFGQLHDLGAIIGITADHGMNDKTRPDGTPNVQFLETRLREAGITGARVILPITDPYVAHHGALGSYATVHTAADETARAMEILRSVPGVELVPTRAEAVKRFSLPEDRIGEVVVLADRHTTLGRTPEWHDLSEVKSGLRSHGGLHEGVVPIIINRPLRKEYADRLASGEARSLDLFDMLFNGTEE